MPKWSRRWSAKPVLAGSSPAATSSFFRDQMTPGPCPVRDGLNPLMSYRIIRASEKPTLLLGVFAAAFDERLGLGFGCAGDLIEDHPGGVAYKDPVISGVGVEGIESVR
jgi:hypothetical protein